MQVILFLICKLSPSHMQIICSPFANGSIECRSLFVEFFLISYIERCSHVKATHTQSFHPQLKRNCSSNLVNVMRCISIFKLHSTHIFPNTSWYKLKSAAWRLLMVVTGQYIQALLKQKNFNVYHPDIFIVRTSSKETSTWPKWKWWNLLVPDHKIPNQSRSNTYRYKLKSAGARLFMVVNTYKIGYIHIQN